MNRKIAVIAATILVISTTHSYGQQRPESSWAEWWTYEGGISGPGFWGRVNPEWFLCARGRRQSPINIEPKTLLFDPNLKHIHIEKHKVKGVLMNNGHDITFTVNNKHESHKVSITGGPFTYRHQVEKIQLHFGYIDSVGSEHTVANKSFPAEVQIVAFNTDLYKNFTQASKSSQGVAIISILVQIGDKPNKEFTVLASHLSRLKYKGSSVTVHKVFIHNLLPPTTSYITYEGSLTQPGCFETATWAVMNKPLYISRKQILQLREILQTKEGNTVTVSMHDNYRPVMPKNQRVVRTNINVPKESQRCTMEKDISYKANIPRK